MPRLPVSAAATCPGRPRDRCLCLRNRRWVPSQGRPPCHRPRGCLGIAAAASRKRYPRLAAAGVVVVHSIKGVYYEWVDLATDAKVTAQPEPTAAAGLTL